MAGIRHKVKAAEKAYNASVSRVTELVDQIADTPAEGVTGVCIKLAAALKYEGDFMCGPVGDLVASAYEATTKQIGVDYAAQVETW